MPRPKFMIERRSPRGLVPTSTYGKLDVSYCAYLDELDPLGDSERSIAVRFALATARDDRFREFLTRIQEPAYRRISLAATAKQVGLSLPEWAEFWQKAQVQRALVKAQDALADITAGIITDALPGLTSCGRCDGFGWVYSESEIPADTPGLDQLAKRTIRTCPECKGAGRVRKTGDSEARKMILEMTGVAGKRNGPAVQIQQNFGGIGSSLEKLNSVAFDLSSEGVTDVVDVTEESREAAE
jgi:hypothetical protein